MSYLTLFRGDLSMEVSEYGAADCGLKDEVADHPNEAIYSLVLRDSATGEVIAKTAGEWESELNMKKLLEELADAEEWEARIRESKDAN